MGHTTAIPTRSFGFYLNGDWITHGRDVVVTSPYDRSAVAVVYEAERRCRGCHRFRGSQHLRSRANCRPTSAPPFCARSPTASLRIARSCAHHLPGGRQAHQDGSHRSGPRRQHLLCRRRRKHADYGEYIPLDALESTAGRWGFLRRLPLGPVFAITPFNFPLNLVAHKVAPAIAAGCPLISKPAPQTPVSSLLLAEIVHESGWPKGAFAVMPLSNENAALLVTDDRIKLLTFTGSAPVGWQLKSKAGKKRVTLELGGNAAVIIHSDADLAHAAHRCVAGGFSYAGQTCISVQRILVHQPAFEKFTGLLLDGVTKLKVGDPMEEDTDVPPLIREQDAFRVSEWIEEALKGGARLLCGGARKGSVVEPAVLTGTSPGMRVNCAEVFGPVVTVEPYDEFSEAVRQVNDSPYGLQAGVFTRDAVRIETAFEELEVGGVIVGDVPSFRVDQMPYGGVKDSGLGREGLRYSIEDMTERKLLVMALK